MSPTVACLLAAAALLSVAHALPVTGKRNLHSALCSAHGPSRHERFKSHLLAWTASAVRRTCYEPPPVALAGDKLTWRSLPKEQKTL